MQLSDLNPEDFAFSEEDEENSDIPDHNAYSNGTYMIVSKVAFLVGIDKRHFENEHEPPKIEWYNALKQDKNARIVRNLCALRNALERNYAAIYKEVVNELKNLSSLPEYVPQECLLELSNDGISVQKANYRPAQYIMDINRLLSDRINNCKNLFPIWLKWEYIKELFIMPNGMTEAGIRKAAEEYYTAKSKYPYQVYINWNGGGSGNILYNDKKFVQLLYEAHEDMFCDMSKVTDAGNLTKSGIYRFLDESERVILVVDCENSDPYKLYAMLQNLDQEKLLAKIIKIKLYDDVHTTNAWKILNEFTGIPIEHNTVTRLVEGKSLVDPSLMLGVSQEFYENGIKAFILLSSDSDYWSLISNLNKARFFVMVEQEKCGYAIKKALVDSGISYCYIDDFCTGNSDEIKIRTILSAVRCGIESAVQLNVKRLLADAIFDARAEMSEAEERQFYDRYVKKLKLDVEDDGTVRLSLPN